MLDLKNLVTTLKRPRFLVQTARIGLESYKRERDIPRLIGPQKSSQIGETIMLLLDEEKEYEAQRKCRAAFYSYAHHIELLTAIMAESSLLQTSQKSQNLR